MLAQARSRLCAGGCHTDMTWASGPPSYSGTNAVFAKVVSPEDDEGP